MLKIEKSLMWTHIQILGADHQLASGIASALGLVMQEDEEMPDLDPACKFHYDLLDSNDDEYSGGSFSFDTDLHKQPTISLYIDYNSEQELKYNALGGEYWLKNLIKEKY